jgi:hypothetical protein
MVFKIPPSVHIFMYVTNSLDLLAMLELTNIFGCLILSDISPNWHGISNLHSVIHTLIYLLYRRVP